MIKILKTISHNHIKIKGIKIIGPKHKNTKNTFVVVTSLNLGFLMTKTVAILFKLSQTCLNIEFI